MNTITDEINKIRDKMSSSVLQNAPGSWIFVNFEVREKVRYQISEINLRAINRLLNWEINEE